jgi:hypothetical protein
METNGTEIKNGILPIDGACPRCGESALRLHTWTFGREEKKPRHYVDCAACKGVAPWKDTPDEAVAAYAAGEEPETEKPAEGAKPREGER